jgi:hypothetical protein
VVAVLIVFIPVVRRQIVPVYQQLMHTLLCIYVGVPIAIHLLWVRRNRRRTVHPHAERVDCTFPRRSDQHGAPPFPMLAHECTCRMQLCGLKAR